MRERESEREREKERGRGRGGGYWPLLDTARDILAIWHKKTVDQAVDLLSAKDVKVTTNK